MASKTFKYSIERELTMEDLKDAFTTAIEGGIGYWACLDNSTDDWKQARDEVAEELKGEQDSWKRTPTYDQIAARLWEKGKPVVFCDAEGGSDVWELTAEKLAAGLIKLMRDRQAESEGDVLYDAKLAIESGDLDAGDADVAVQYALFGELVFG